MHATTRRRGDVPGGPPSKRPRRTAATSKSPASPSAPLSPALSTLDTQMFPHLLDHIVDLAEYHSLVALRAVNRALRARADERLSERLIVRAPASKRTPGLYIYTLASVHPHAAPIEGNSDVEPLPIPGFAFYPFASDRPYTSRIAAEEDAWTRVQAGREEYGDDHWAWNYSNGEWERVWRAWGVRPPTAIPDGERGLRVVGDAEPEEELSAGALPRPNFRREMREAEIARAFKWSARPCAAVRSLDVIGPVGREAQRLFHGMRGVRTLRIAGSGRGETVAVVPVPAPHVDVYLSFARPRPDAPAQERVPHAMVPRLIEGVRTLTLHVTVERVGDGGTPYGVILPFSHPYSLREVVVILRRGERSGAEESTEPSQRFGMLDAVLDQAMPRLDHVGHTIVGLDPYTYPALGGAPPPPSPQPRGANDASCADSAQGQSALDERTEAVKANFLRRLERRVRERAGVSAQFGRPWSEERIEAVVAGVRLPSLQEWEAQARDAAGRG